MNYCGPRGIPLSTFLEWSASDQDAALAWANAEAQKCPGCGTSREDWREDDKAYHAHNVYCPGCAARSSAGNEESAKIAGVQTQLARGVSSECQVCNQAH